ncbi:MAG TPA: DUF6662 family protein [bacterium]|nr:DUF6662 family protein [bacterium]
MKKTKSLLYAALFAAGMVPPAGAGEGLFSFTYTTDTTPAGHFEFEQLVRNRAGRASGSYSAEDFNTELEYGITDNLQGAFYFNTGRVDAANTLDDDGAGGDGQVAAGRGVFNNHDTFVQGIAAEFLYRLLSPYTDGIGLAVYFEPELDFTDLHNGLPYNGTMENEYKLILQKNFLEDKLVLAYDATVEAEYIRFGGGQSNVIAEDQTDSWAGELDYNNDFGISYRFAPDFFAGLELHNHNEYGGFNRWEHTVVWVGPDFHYGGEGFWATLGVLKQVYGAPNGIDDSGVFIGSGEFLRSHEDLITTLKVGVPL